MIKKLFPELIVITFLAMTASAQTSVSGKVVEAIDGRTLVLETSAGRISARLQYVEVPQDGEPLFDVTKRHLSEISNGKMVELKPQRIVGGKTIGRVTLDGVDLSLQMIRDGAAWHEPKETSGQHPDEATDYEANQVLAKNEKRGVWSGAILKTPWEVRAEQAQTRRAAEIARRIAHPTKVGVGEFHSDTRRPSGQYTPTAANKGISQRSQMDAWVNVFSQVHKEPYGLLTYSDPQGRFTGVYTSASLVDFVSPSGKERLECRTMMVAPTLYNGGRGKVFLIGFRAISSDYRFSKGKTRLTVMADRQSISLGTAFGFRGKASIGTEEIMYFRLTWAQMKKIGTAKKVEFRINTLTGPLPDDSRELIKQLAEATG